MPTIHRLPWGDFPDVVVHTTVSKLTAHPDYARAKSGDPDAGIRLAADLVKVEKVNFPIVDAVVPVVQPDAGRKNAIPISVAAILAQRLGLEPVGAITQTNDVAHTKANAASRILAQPTFGGRIRPYARVLIVDDVVTFGSTIANLRGWIHQQRAVAIGCTCLAAAFGSTKPRPPSQSATNSINVTTTPIVTWRKEWVFLASVGPTAKRAFLYNNHPKLCSNSSKPLTPSIASVTNCQEPNKNSYKSPHSFRSLRVAKNLQKNRLHTSTKPWYTRVI